MCFLIFLQNKKGWRTSYIYTNFEDVLLGAYICQSVNGNKRVGSEAPISMQYCFSDPVILDGFLNYCSCYSDFSHSIVPITHPNILSVFTRLGNIWMHGVCSFGRQHQPFSLSLHLDSIH